MDDPVAKQDNFEIGDNVDFDEQETFDDDLNAPIEDPLDEPIEKDLEGPIEIDGLDDDPIGENDQPIENDNFDDINLATTPNDQLEDSHADLFLASRASDTQRLTSAKSQKEEVKEPKKWPSKFHMVRFGVYLIILVGVVVMCVVSGVLSILTLMDTMGKPVSTFEQEVVDSKYHDVPGVIFLAERLKLISCQVFNQTSLDIDDLPKKDKCFPQSFTLYHNDYLTDEFEATLNEILTAVRDSNSQVTAWLVKGPSDWSNRESTISHLIVPDELTGVWAMVHPDYSDISSQQLEVFSRFKGSTVGGADAALRWDVLNRLLETYTLNLVASNFRSYYQMNKQIFKWLSTIEAIRIDMEISLMESNTTQLDEDIEEEGYNPALWSHVEAIYQWKNKFYQQGDSFYAVTGWSIVTVVSSALLMLERGYNTLMKAWNQAKPKPKPKKDPEAAPAEKPKHEEEIVPENSDETENSNLNQPIPDFTVTPPKE